MSGKAVRYAVSWQAKAQIDLAALRAGMDTIRVWQDGNWQWRVSGTHRATGERIVIGAKTKRGLLAYLNSLARVAR